MNTASAETPQANTSNVVTTPDLPSSYSTIGSEASLFDVRDLAPIELPIYDIRTEELKKAWEQTKFTCSTHFRQRGYPATTELMCYVAWHNYCLDIAMIALETAWSTEKVKTAILHTLRTKRLPFQSEKLKDLLTPALEEAPLSTINILRHRRLLLGRADRPIYQGDDFQSRSAYTLWHEDDMSLAEICLILVQRPGVVLGYILDRVDQISRQSQTKVEQNLVDKFATGKNVLGFATANNTHFLELRRNSAIEDLELAMQPNSCPTSTSGTNIMDVEKESTIIEPGTGTYDTINNDKPIDRVSYPSLAKWDILAQELKDDHDKRHNGNVDKTAPNDEPKGSDVVESQVLEGLEGLSLDDTPMNIYGLHTASSDIEQAWDQYLDDDAELIVWD